MPVAPKFEDSAAARDACAERCAEFGEPPCFEVVSGCTICAECLRDIGIEPGDEFDAGAAVGLLL